jgi:hypothetical protein
MRNPRRALGMTRMGQVAGTDAGVFDSTCPPAQIRCLKRTLTLPVMTPLLIKAPRCTFESYRSRRGLS